MTYGFPCSVGENMEAFFFFFLMAFIKIMEHHGAYNYR